jgi:uncharacterized protein with PIN domain
MRKREKRFRGCKNCPKRFEYRREDHVFCSAKCRKEFWRHGGASFNRLVEQLRRALMPEVIEAARDAAARTIESDRRPAA